MNLTPSLCSLLLVSAVGCASQQVAQSRSAGSEPANFGVLVMAHGGSSTWNGGVLEAVQPLRDQYDIEVAFGMADAVSIQAALEKLEARGIQEIAVVRLFISGESWYERTEKILGIRDGAPDRPAAEHQAHGGHGGHSMEFWRAASDASFALSTEGLSEAQGMGGVLSDRVRALSRDPEHEDVLILAHGPGDDAENERWIATIEARATAVSESLPLRSVQVETLREDWPEKREEAELRIRAFVERAAADGGTAIVIPFRVQGFGPYAEVLDGLEYVSDGKGLVPHRNVTQWIAAQIAALQRGPFRSTHEG